MPVPDSDPGFAGMMVLGIFYEAATMSPFNISPEKEAALQARTDQSPVEPITLSNVTA